MCIYCGDIYENHRSEFPDASDVLGSAVIGTNQGLASYLTNGFWDDMGYSPRRFNLTSTGVNSKNGVLTYNTSGNSSDINGISSEKSLLVDESFKLLESTLGIDFQETANANADIRFSDSDSGACYNCSSCSFTWCLLSFWNC